MCYDVIYNTYTNTDQTQFTHVLDLTNGYYFNSTTVNLDYQAYDRPNRFNLYVDGVLAQTSQWVGTDDTYSGPWGDAGDVDVMGATGTFTFNFSIDSTYEILVEVGPANPSTPTDDVYTININCPAVSVQFPTPTPTPTNGYAPTVQSDCTVGMDVVFALDYSNDMSNWIPGIQTNIDNLLDEIETKSDNDYRLGLVLFDEKKLLQSPNYSDATAYTSLPGSQKYSYSNVLKNRKQIITAMEMMSSNNRTTFKSQLEEILTENFPIGDGVDYGEPSDVAIDRIVNHDFAGTFRTGVEKVIILITSEPPSGRDDRYTQKDIDDVMDLKDDCVNNYIKVLLLRPFYAKAYDFENMRDRNYSVLDDLAYGTGGTVRSLSTTTSIISLISAIEDICTNNS